MKSAFISLMMALSFVSCHRNQSDPQPDPILLEVQKQAKLLDETRRLDLPIFDDSNTDRLFPYSPVAVTQLPRLIQTKENGVTVLNYRYDSAGRLQEAYHNFTYTEEASSRQVYQYGEQGLQKISFYYGSMPGFQLNLIRTLTFTTNRLGKIDRYYESSSSPQQLRFDQSGHLIWSAVIIGDPNSSTEVGGYTRAIRDANNNVRTLRSPVREFYTIDYEYDNKPNPFYLLNVPDFTSPNNIIKETKRDLSGKAVSITEYRYDYRADGYPIRRRSGTDVFEYIYEN